MEKSVLRTALTFGVARRFLVPKCFILYSACVQVYTSATGAAPNQSSPAFLRASVSPSPSLKSIARTTRLVEETTALEMFNSTNVSLMNMPKPSSEVLVSSRHATVVIESSIRTNTNFRANGEPTNRVRVEHADEDKSVVFYRKIGGWITLGIVSTTLLFLIITHFSSIYHVNQRGRIPDPYCSVSQKSQDIWMVGLIVDVQIGCRRQAYGTGANISQTQNFCKNPVETILEVVDMSSYSLGCRMITFDEELSQEVY